MNSIASSIFSQVMTGRMGPKISSVIIFEVRLGFTTIVGATYRFSTLTWPRE